MKIYHMLFVKMGFVFKQITYCIFIIYSSDLWLNFDPKNPNNNWMVSKWLKFAFDVIAITWLSKQIQFVKQKPFTKVFIYIDLLGYNENEWRKLFNTECPKLPVRLL